jgi:hypothetical protein
MLCQRCIGLIINTTEVKVIIVTAVLLIAQENSTDLSRKHITEN